MTPVSIQGICKRYGDGPPVLQGIDLEVAAGELLFLLGGSGCGKTTLLRTVAGFLKPDAGMIRFAGQDVTALPPEHRRLGMVFQHYALWPHLTVAENVAFPLEVQGVRSQDRPQRVAEALALVELGSFGKRRIGELSGGQQQRVALARAIVGQPQVLLLDEPLSNLDPELRGSLRSSIRRVCKATGLTALYVTHDRAEALSTADRIALMVSGQVAQIGTPRQLYDQPINATVAAFLGEVNRLTAAQAQQLVGQSVVGVGACGIRPERIGLTKDRGVPGLIQDGTYEGDRAVWQIQVEGIGLLTVAEPAPQERHPGDAVRLVVHAADVLRFAEQEAP
jgi:ABC-type Fe3+/spermidine/putrescine transport system ATPase subunit